MENSISGTHLQGERACVFGAMPIVLGIVLYPGQLISPTISETFNALRGARAAISLSGYSVLIDGDTTFVHGIHPGRFVLETAEWALKKADRVLIFAPDHANVVDLSWFTDQYPSEKVFTYIRTTSKLLDAWSEFVHSVVDPSLVVVVEPLPDRVRQ